MSALGSLVVSLGLEYAKFTGGLDKSEQAALAASKRIQDTMDGLKSKLATTAGAIAGGLAAGFTIAAFKNIISGAIETGAALDDLRMQTGASVEALTGLLAIGKFNDVGPEKLGAAMNKLASNLAGATEESKGTGKAVEALGLDFEKFKQLRPEEQMQTVAQAMAKFEDGSGKSALAMALFGKEGAKMLPFLNDLAQAGELQAKMTTEQAAAAANLDDNLKRLTTSGEGWKRELANGMIPALDLGAQALVDMMNGSGGLREQVKKLSADGSIKQWTTDAINGLSYVADAGHIAFRVLQSIGKGMGGLAASLVQALSGDFRGAWNTLKESGRDMIVSFDGETVGARFRASLAKIGAAAAEASNAAKEAKPSLDGFTNSTAKVGKAAAETKDPFDALRDSIVKTTALYQAELSEGEKLTEGQKKAVDVLDQLRTGKVKVTEAQAIQISKDIEAMLAAEQENKAREEFIKSAEAERAARIKIAQAAEQHSASLAEQNRSMREEIELIGLTEAGQLAILRARNNATIAVKEATLAELERQAAITGTMTREQVALQAEIDLLRERNDLLGIKFERTAVAKAADEYAQEWKRTTEQINGSLTDALLRGFESGKDFAENLRDTVVNMFKTMILRPVISAIINPVAQAASGVVSNVMGGIGSNMLGSMGISALGGAGFFSGITTAVAAGFKGATLGAGLMGPTTAGAGGAMGFGNMLASIPGWGWALAGIAALGMLFSKKSTPHSGAGAIYSEAGGLQSGADIYNKDTFGMGIAKEWNAQTQDAMSSLAKGLTHTFDGIAKAFGKTAGYEIATAFADDTSKDGAWGQLRITKDGKDLLNWAANPKRDGIPREFGDGEEGYKQYLAAVAKDTRQVLLDMDLPSWADTLLESIGDAASMDDLSAAVQQIGLIQSAFEDLGKSIEGFATMTDKAFEALMKASGGIDALVQNAGTYYQNFYSEDERKAAVSRQVGAEFDKLGITMPKTREEFRQLVEHYMAMGEEGAKVVAVLLAVSGAFASVTSSAEDAKKVQEDMAKRLAEEAKAARDSAYNSLVRSIAEQRKVLDAQRAVAAEAQAAWAGIANVARDAMRDIRGEVASTAALQAAQGWAFIEQAVLDAQVGKAINSDGLSAAITAARGGFNSGNYATQFELDRDRLVLAGHLDQLATLAGKQKTTAELQLESLDRQIQQGEDMLDYWKKQLDKADGNIEATLSVTEAIKALQELMFPGTTGAEGGDAGATAGSGGKGGKGTAGGAVFGGTSPDRSIPQVDSTVDGNGLRTYADGSTYQMSADEFYVYKLWLAGKNPAAGHGSIPAFAGGGDHRGGWAMVGEQGPELAYLPPARIYTAGTTRSMLGGGASADPGASTFNALQVAELRDEMKKSNEHLKKVADALEGASEGNALRFTPA